MGWLVCLLGPHGYLTPNLPHSLSPTIPSRHWPSIGSTPQTVDQHWPNISQCLVFTVCPSTNHRAGGGGWETDASVFTPNAWFPYMSLISWKHPSGSIPLEASLWKHPSGKHPSGKQIWLPRSEPTLCHNPDGWWWWWMASPDRRLLWTDAFDIIYSPPPAY